MSVQEAVNTLEAALASVNHPLIATLAPGLPRHRINQLATAANLTLPDDLVELWAWRNGPLPNSGAVRHHGDNEFPGGYQLFSVTDALSVHHRFLEDFPFVDLDWVKPHWLEVFRSERRSLRIDLTTTQGRVVPYDIDNHDPTHPENAALPSISDLLHQMVELLEEGHWADQGRYWTTPMDFDRSAYPWMS